MNIIKINSHRCRQAPTSPRVLASLWCTLAARQLCSRQVIEMSLSFNLISSLPPSPALDDERGTGVKEFEVSLLVYLHACNDRRNDSRNDANYHHGLGLYRGGGGNGGQVRPPIVFDRFRWRWIVSVAITLTIKESNLRPCFLSRPTARRTMSRRC